MRSPGSSRQENVVRARRLCELGRWPEVLAFAQTWQRELPEDSRAWFYGAAALAALGRFEEAENGYRRALALDENDFKAWNNLAALLFQALNRRSEGAQCLARALQIEPDNKLGWANLASMHGQVHRHDQALQCAERALKIDPGMVEAHLHRARAAQALGLKDIVRASCEALARLPQEQFHRAR